MIYGLAKNAVTNSPLWPKLKLWPMFQAKSLSPNSANEVEKGLSDARLNISLHYSHHPSLKELWLVV